MKKLNGIMLGKILNSGTNALLNNKDRIDKLNVFPVPDGDTGSNMSSTVEYAYSTISKIDEESIGIVSSKFSRGMILGARGNSGVILSQIFKGFSVGLHGKDEASTFDIVEAFEQARIYAYKAVMVPIEGTILTVIRMISENLAKTITPSMDIIKTFELIVEFADKAIKHTPELLPVLKEVGVVDSGGEGLGVFLKGMLQMLKGNMVKKGIQIAIEENLISLKEGHELEFGYCTEFILDLKKPKMFDKNNFEKNLLKQGSSLIVVRDENIVKIHIHTRKPGDVLNFGLKYGEFSTIKIDNMTIQANESHSSKKNSNVTNKIINDIAVISCNTGQGIINDMIEYGTHFIIEAGQTENPSAQDFIKSIEETGANKIIILPNNSNIILAAQQVAQTSDKDVIVIPTKTQMQGLSAMMNFSPDVSLKENKEEMDDAINNVKTGQVTIASRTTKIEGVSIIEGEYLSIAERKIINSHTTSVEAAINISKKLINDDTEIVTIYYGDNATETDAEEIASFIETHYDIEIEIKFGKQKVYNFLIAYE